MPSRQKSRKSSKKCPRGSIAVKARRSASGKLVRSHCRKLSSRKRVSKVSYRKRVSKSSPRRKSKLKVKMGFHGLTHRTRK